MSEPLEEPAASLVRSLHSRYNPRLEAERYINALPLRENIRCFILIEPGLAYCIPPLRNRFPAARIIALHLSDDFSQAGIEGVGSPDARWSPGTGIPVTSFLEKEIRETEAAAIKIVEWRPALNLFGEQYLRLLSDCAAFIKRLDAGDRTLRQFGGRWFRNFFRNLSLLQKTISLSPISCPLVVSGAGPSLEDALPLITKNRDRIFLLAVSSSMAALEAHALRPDLLISTDGGNWALWHLYESLRGGGSALAASLTAALPSQCSQVPIIPVSDDSLWQRLVLEGLAIPSLRLPQRGTVSAAALDLAFFISRGAVFITGMDLSHRDIRTHARPYAFDRLWEEGATRFDPAYGRRCIRAGEIAAGGSQAIYAAWFKQQIASWPGRLYSLGGNSRAFEGLEVREDLFRSGAETGEKPPLGEIPLSLPGNLSGRGGAILCKALDNPLYREKLLEELVPLFNMDGASPEDLKGEILERLRHTKPGGTGG